MTLYPSSLEQRFSAKMRALQASVAKLQTRTAGIDSGFPLAVLPGVIDSGYSGSGNPMAYVNGAAALSGPYAFLASYAPAPGDSVFMAPVGAQQTYVILGAVTASPWQPITIDAGWAGTAPNSAVPSYRLLPDGRLELTGCESFGSSQTVNRNLNSSNPLPYIPLTNKTLFSYDGQLARATVVLQGQDGAAPGVIEAFGSSSFPWEYCEINATVPLNL
jgi:hypothetical protein